MRSRNSAYLFSLPLLLTLAYGMQLLSQAPINDESGTIVAIIKQKDMIALLADSKITYADGFVDKPSGATVPSSKLVKIGKASACTVVGYEGDHLRHSSIGANLAYWAATHPDHEAKQALPSLLEVASAEWDKRNFQPDESIPLNRRPGDEITAIYCGTFIDGRSAIVGGSTWLGKDLKAKAVIDPKISSRAIYIDGVISTEVLNQYLLGRNNPVHTSAFIPVLAALDKLMHRPEAEPFLQIYRNSLLVNKSPTVFPEIERANMRGFFVALFDIVEDVFKDTVAPPNSLWIVRTSGLEVITLEKSSNTDW